MKLRRELPTNARENRRLLRDQPEADLRRRTRLARGAGTEGTSRKRSPRCSRTGQCYARVLSGTRLGFNVPKQIAGLGVVERLQGNATTDFGAMRWTGPWFVRRVAWHVISHAWEIETRDTPLS